MNQGLPLPSIFRFLTLKRQQLTCGLFSRTSPFNHISFVLSCIVCLLAVSVPSISQADLVAHWTFDDAAGSTSAVDTTGSFNATAKGTVTFGETGKFGNAVSLVGSSSNNLAVPEINCFYTGDCSFSAWIKMPAVTNAAQFFGDWSSPWSFRLFTSSNGSVQVNYRVVKDNNVRGSAISSDWDTVSIASAASAVVADTWTHVAATRDISTGTFSLYVNGALAGTTDSEISVGKYLTNYSSLNFGYKQDGGGDYTGALDEAYVFDSVLTRAQVKSLYLTNTLDSWQPVPYSGTVSLEKLIGTVNHEMISDIMESPGHNSTSAKTTNLGISQVLASKSAPLTGTQDLTGVGSKFNMEALGVNTSYINCNVLCNRVEGAEFNVDGQTNGLGMHANALVTFDLDEIRAGSSLTNDQWYTFTTVAGVNKEAGLLNAAVIVWDANNNVIGSLVNGEYQAVQCDGETGVWSYAESKITETTTSANLSRFNITLPGSAKYLTLISAAGESGNSDHGVFAAPTLTYMETPAILLNQVGNASSRMQARDDSFLDSLTDSAAITSNMFGVDAVVTSNLKQTVDLNSDSVKLNLDNITDNTSTGTVVSRTTGAAPAGYSFLGAVEIENNAIVTYALEDFLNADDMTHGSDYLFTATAVNTDASDTTGLDALVLLSNADGLQAAFWQGQAVDFTESNGVWSIDMTNQPTSILADSPVDFSIQFPTGFADYLSIAMINGSGQFLNPSLATRTPEPATWALLLTGLIGIAVLKRRKSAAKD